MAIKYRLKRSWQDGSLLFTALMAVLLLLRWGFAAGRSDQAEIMPYALWLNDNSLFPSDLFLQSIIQIVPNERWVISQLLALWGDHIVLGLGFYHLGSLVMLLLGLQATLRHLIQHKYACWVSIFLILIPFFLWNPGANDLYYNTFTAAPLAKGIVIWAIFLWLKDRLWGCSILLIVGTWVHPLVGLQVAMLIFGVELIRSRKDLFKDFNLYIIPLFLYLILGCAFVLWIKMGYDGAAPTQTQAEFFQLIFDFRNGHHYMPSQYPLKSWMMAASCWGLAFWQFKSLKIRLFLIFMLLGCIAYTVGVEVLRSPTLAAFQWFKTTIWLKVLGFAAAMKWAVRWFQLPSIRHEKRLLGLGFALSLAILLFGRNFLPWQVPFDFGQQQEQDSLINIALEAKAETPKEALFIHPMEIDAFIFYSQRGSYVSYKANIKQNAGAKIWANRIQELYHFDFYTSYPDKKTFAKEAFLQLGEKELKALAEKGVTHILTYSTHILPERWLILENADWKIYEISD